MIFEQKGLTKLVINGNIDKYGEHAGVAELADAQDLKSCEVNPSYRFDSGLRHHLEYSSVKFNMYRGVEQSGSSSGS